MAVGRLKVWNHVTGAWEYVAPGLMCATGPAGTNGTNGTNGATGPQGATGAQGPSGTPGTGNVSTTGAQTLTNKKIEIRINAVTGSVTGAQPSSSYDMWQITGLTSNITLGVASYTPVNGDKTVFRIRDNGTARTITFSSDYKAIGVTLPTTTVANKWVYIGVQYSSVDSIWHVIAVTQES